MTQAFNLSQLANKVNTSGQLDLATGVNGTLPIANGGTGTTSTTFCNLVTNTTGTLPISKGGTGATTASTALSNLGGLSGSTNQLAKAWVHFNGSGGIYSSYNVSSVTQLGTGRYRVNFNPSFSNSNYAMCGSASGSSGNVFTSVMGWAPDDNNYSNSSVTIATEGVNGVLYDGLHTSVIIFSN